MLQETSNLNTAKKSQCSLCNTQCSLWLNSKLIHSKLKLSFCLSANFLTKIISVLISVYSMTVRNGHHRGMHALSNSFQCILPPA